MRENLSELKNLEKISLEIENNQSMLKVYFPYFLEAVYKLPKLRNLNL